MKTFKRLMSFALALLMLASVIPLTAISARAAPTETEMENNYVLDAMEYLGFRMDDFKSAGKLYEGQPNDSVPYASDIRYDDKYWGDGVEGTLRGLETTKDANGNTIPDVDKFETNGLVCASYVSYYYLNYLPNIKGVNLDAFKADMQTWKDKSGLSWQGAWLWRYALEKISATENSSVTRIYYAKYNAKDTSGNPKKPSTEDYAKMQVGDIVTFGYEDENGNEKFSHVAIYLGERNGKHWISHCVPRTYTSNGTTHHVSVVFGSVEGMYSTDPDNPKPVSVVTGVYRIKNFTHFENTGKIEVYKKDPNGKALAGAKFLATNTSTGEQLPIGPTDSNGYAYIKEVPYGTYKVVETVFPEGYTTSGTSEWTVTLNANTSNATITINAVNKLITGTGKIKKVSTNSGTVQGWKFRIWDSNWNWIADKTTDANGEISLTLEPGSYIVRETGAPDSQSGKLDYWVMDTADRTLTVEANKTSTVTFTNSYYGKIKIQKSTNTGGDLAGWKFTILNSSGSLVTTVTTDSNGVATSGNLAPGTYYVKEVDAPSNTDGWFMDITTSGGVVCANNLLVNSDFANGTKNWTGSNSTGVSVTTVDGKKVLKADPSVGTQDVGYVTQSVYRTGAGKYTLSADIYVEQDRKIYLAMWDASSGSWSGLGTTTKNLKAGWNHVEHTFNISKDCNLIIAGIGGGKSSGAFYVYHPKFVCGDTATPWTADRTVTVTAGSTATHNVKNVKGGKIAVQKNTNTGEYLSGWQFEVKDSSGKLITTLVTDTDGYAVTEILAPGTYTVTEIGNSNPDFNPDYWDMDNTPTRTVVISADSYKEIQTANYNNVHQGVGLLKKVTVNGGTVENWCFQLWRTEEGKAWEFINNFRTDENGEIKFALEPGRYAVRELNLSNYPNSLPEGVDPEYWECDYATRYFIVEAGKTTAIETVTNKLLGKIKVQKSTNTGGDLEGWVFAVKDADGNVVATITTDNEGKAETELLNPGIYTVTEVGGPDGLFGSAEWFCDISETNGIVEVEAGSTATHNVKNVKGGKISVWKNTNTGNWLDGWLFEIRNADGDLIETLETDEYGGANSAPLAPGIYTITEIGHTDVEGFDPDLWVMDAVSTHEVEISADTYEEFETVFYRNSEKGTGTIKKVVLNGGSVEGWDFKIADTDGNTVFEGETDENGLLNFALEAGTYHVYETEVREHYINDTAEYKIVEIVAGKTAEAVTFTNTFVPPPGVAQIVKTSTNGGAVAGWAFIIEDSNGVKTEVVTDESGVITVELEPGSYKVYEKPVSDDYWIQDETVYEFTLESEEVKELPFTNRWLGELEITKTLLQPDDGTLDGWAFLIEKVVEVDGEVTVESSFTAVTDENGLISQFIEPGTYRITEVLEDSIWEPTCENPQIVEIVAGETRSVAFENRLKPGRIEITKINPKQEYLPGVKLLLEWFDEGTQEWKPVEFVPESDTLTKGGCTSADLIDGTLTTGNDGVVAFEGLHPMLQYRVTELETAADYQLMADYVYVGEIPEDTLEVKRTLVNFWKFVLPSVGEWDLAIIVGIAPLMAALAIMLAFIACALPFFQRQTCRMKKYNTKGKPKMKKTNRILTLLLVLCLTIGMALPAFAAETAATAIIDYTRTGSITLTKYDMTTAADRGDFQPGSFVSTGTANSAVEEALKDYAIQGVIFSYAKIADIATYSAVEGDKHITMILYAFPEGDATNALLSALGLTAADAYPNAEGEAGKLYFKSATLDSALSAKLTSNSSTVKNALEQYMKSYGTKMPETSATGRSAVSGLDLGLYLLVETYVPETVSQTTAPFFVSVPSTTVDGKEWNYDIILYPKNQTSAPNLDKTLRENKEDTGKNEGTGSITDGYAPTGTASAGDVVDYQFVSTLPAISSSATHLSCYDFFDVLSKGIEYNKNDVVIEWYTDADCTDLITSWTEADGKFTVTYGEGENDSTTMTVSMTETGLYEINNSTAVYGADSVYQGYSDCTVRVTYACTVNSNADVVYGDAGNPNTVTLTWKRTNELYYDTLTDDAHVYTYGMELVKKFIDKAGNEVEGNFENVHFLIQNQTDGYWLVAERSEDGIYYVTDHAAEETNATIFACDADGNIVIKGIEDDTYVITEKQSDAGFSMLEKPIEVVITASGNGEICAVCGVEGITASAVVDGDEFPMIEDNGSTNAIVTNLIVKNIAHPTIPETGDFMTWFIPAVSTVALFSGVVLLLLSNKSIRKKFGFN